MYKNLSRLLAPALCFALVTCSSLVTGVAEDGISSSSWSGPPLALQHLVSSTSADPEVNDGVNSLLAGSLHLQPSVNLHKIPERTSRPLRILSPGVPKRLYFAPRLGKRNLALAEGLDGRERRDGSYPEESEDALSIPYRWWWPLMSVRRSSFSPRPGKRMDGQMEMDLPYDFEDEDWLDTTEEEDEIEDEDKDHEDETDWENKVGMFQEKRGSGFAFSPRLGKRGRSMFSFGPRPGKKSNFAFAPRLGKKTNFAFAPRPGKRTSFAFAPRPGKKSNFAFAPRPGKKTNFAFSPRLGKKAGFAFGPRPGKRAVPFSEAGQRQDRDAWWHDETETTPTTTLAPFLD